FALRDLQAVNADLGIRTDAWASGRADEAPASSSRPFFPSPIQPGPTRDGEEYRALFVHEVGEEQCAGIQGGTRAFEIERPGILQRSIAGRALLDPGDEVSPRPGKVGDLSPQRLDPFRIARRLEAGQR